jgi:hypothetical protein
MKKRIGALLTILVFTFTLFSTYARADTALAGTISINGILKYNEQLTADTTGLTSAEPGTLSYQWQRNGSDINGAYGSTYTVLQEDIGAILSVTVSAENYSGSLTGTASEAIAKADGPSAPSAPSLLSRTASSIILTATEGYEYSRDGTSWQSSNIFTDLSAGTAYTFYQRTAATSTNEASAASDGASFSTTSGSWADYAASGFGGGDGTEASPYLISTPGQLAYLANQVNSVANYSQNKYFRLNAALDLSEHSWVPIGKNTDSYRFKGVFDGDSKTVGGIIIEKGISDSGNKYLGLFGYNSGTIENLNVILSVITGYIDVGGIAGANSGTIKSCNNYGSITAISQYSGGIAGYNVGTISGCRNDGTIKGTAGYNSSGDSVGGITGYNGNLGVIENCRNAGTVTGLNNCNNIGGIAGLNKYTISDSCNEGTVSGQNYDVGAIAGQNTDQNNDTQNARIERCYNKGVVSGKSRVGGIAGKNVDVIVNCYNIQTVSVAYPSTVGQAGGIAGEADSGGVISKCYSIGEITGSNGQNGLLVGTLSGSTIEYSFGVLTQDMDLIGVNYNGTGTVTGCDKKTHEQLKSAVEYSQWDFDNIWNIDGTTNNGYPFLRKISGGAQAALTGSVSVTGTLKYGHTLTAEVTGQQNDASLAYQWQRDGSDIEGADGSTYTVSEEDIGAELSVTVRAENYSGSLTGTVSGTIAKADGPSAPSAPSLLSRTTSGISLTATAGYEYRREGTSWQSSNIFTGLSAGTAYTFYQRTAATATHEASAASDGASFSTLSPPQDEDTGGNTNTPSSSGNGAASSDIAASKVDAKGNITASPNLDKEGVAAATVGKDALASALEKASKDSDGKTSVEISIPKIEGSSSYMLTLPAASLSSDDSNTQYEVKTDIATVTLPSDMLTQDTSAGGINVSISIARAEVSGIENEEIRNSIGNRPLIQLNLSLDGRQTDWSNTNSPVIVSIPYTPADSESDNTESIVIWYIDGKGKAVCIPDGRYDPATGTVTFSATHFSLYAVACNSVSFSDMPAGSWYEKAVSFIAARGIAQGTGEGNFSPYSDMTRAMAVTVLHRLSGDTASYESVFTDVQSGAWYEGSVGWAAANGVANGVGGELFDPCKEITREQLAVMLYNYAKVKKYDVYIDKDTSILSFSDAPSVSDYAYDAMRWACSKGIIKGDTSGKLNPGRVSTRAEVAVMLERFIKNMYN